VWMSIRRRGCIASYHCSGAHAPLCGLPSVRARESCQTLRRVALWHRVCSAGARRAPQSLHAWQQGFPLTAPRSAQSHALPLARAQSAFELLTVQHPRATAHMMEGMARRLAAASTARLHRAAADPSGRAAVSAPTGRSAEAPGAGGGAAGGAGGARRGEIVTIALVPAGAPAAAAQFVCEGS